MIDNYLKILHEQKGKSDVKEKIIDFFKGNPKPSDDEVHALASELNLNPHRFEEEIYTILGTLVSGIGKHQDDPDENFNPNELAKGIEIELEHTDCKHMAKEIAKDHLAECQDYYTRLERMEAECKRK